MEAHLPLRLPWPRKLHNCEWWLQLTHLRSPRVTLIEMSPLEPIFESGGGLSPAVDFVSALLITVLPGVSTNACSQAQQVEFRAD